MRFLNVLLLMISFSAVAPESSFAAKDGCTLIRKASRSARISLSDVLMGDLQCAKFDIPAFSIGVLIYSPTSKNTSDNRFIQATKLLMDQTLPAEVHRFKYKGKETILVGPSDFSVPRQFKTLDEMTIHGDFHAKRRLEFINIGQTVAELAAEENPTDADYLIDKLNQEMSDYQKQVFFEAMLDAIAGSLDDSTNGSTRFAYLLSMNWQRDRHIISHDVYSLLLNWGIKNRDLVKLLLENK